MSVFVPCCCASRRGRANGWRVDVRVWVCVSLSLSLSCLSVSLSLCLSVLSLVFPRASKSPSTPTNGASSTEQWVSNVIGSLAAGYQPTGEVLLLSVYAYLTAVCFLPPRAASSKTLTTTVVDAAPHPTLRRLGLQRMGSALDMVGVVLGVRDGTELDAPSAGFNLHSACWMFDLSWAAYYDAPGHRTASSFGSFTELPHGFKVRLVVQHVACTPS